MADNSLHELLERLRGHLKSGSVEADAQQQLHSLVHDIEHRPGEATGSATQRLESLAVRFEASHPDLAATLREAVDLLGKAGL
jgi:hypothetical protein